MNYIMKWVDEGLLQLRPGIKSLIDNARKSKIQLAISTSTSLMNVEALFKKCFEIKPDLIFKVIATGDMVKRKKPDPELYLLALNQLSLRPIQCIALEDSNNGLISAKRAKLKTICSPVYIILMIILKKLTLFAKNLQKISYQ